MPQVGQVQRDVQDVRSDRIRDNDTWCECRGCGRTWKSEKAVPGLIHAFVICYDCQQGKGARGRTC